MRKALSYALTLAWIASVALSASRSGADSGAPDLARRQAVVEWLDRLVRAEHAHQQKFGAFTAVTARLQLETPDWVAQHYAWNVQLRPNGFIVHVESEATWDPGMHISSNQDSSWGGNFALPEPRAEFLHELARKNEGGGYRGGFYREYYRRDGNEWRVTRGALAGQVLGHEKPLKRRVASQVPSGDFEVESLVSAPTRPLEIESLQNAEE